MDDPPEEEPEETPRREQLQEILEDIVDNVYFQPPPSFKMTYPCIVYGLDDIDTKFADNAPYAIEMGYALTLIDRNPDSSTIATLAKLPKCVFERHFISDNLNHYRFKIYY